VIETEVVQDRDVPIGRSGPLVTIGGACLAKERVEMSSDVVIYDLGVLHSTWLHELPDRP